MAVVSLNTIKNWFRTGLRPTQVQFWDTWDSFWHKTDSIPMSSIEGLETAFSNLEFPSIDATGFRLKEEKQEAYIYGTGETTMSALASASYRIMGGFTEIHGILSAFTLIYLGREHTFFNAQATDVILKHGITDASWISFDFPNGEDITLLPGQMIKVKFVKTTGYYLELVSKNFSTIIDNLNSYNFLVNGNGTDIENAAELQAMYNFAKTQSPSATNILTVVVAPGNYNFEENNFVLDTEYINVVSLDGNQSVIFNSLYSKGTINVNIGNVFVKGIDVLLKRFLVADFSSIKIDNCNGGAASFAARYIFEGGYSVLLEGNNIASGVFINCTAGDGSFGGYVGTASGTFTNCTGGKYSFGTYFGTASGIFTNCTGGEASFGSSGTASGTFTNCIGGGGSFGGGGEASGKFTNCKADWGSFGGDKNASGVFLDCIGGDNSFGFNATGNFINCIGRVYCFGNTYGFASGKFTNCEGMDKSFGHSGTASGTFVNCRALNYSFGGLGGKASGTFINCIGGQLSFGDINYTYPDSISNLTGRLYYCRLTIGKFTNVSKLGLTVMCVDGLNNINNQPLLVKTISTSNYFQNATLVPTVIEDMTAKIPNAGTYKIEFNGQFNTALKDVTAQSVIDLNTLYLNLKGHLTTSAIFPTFGANTTITAGVYETAGAVGPVGSITLDGQGNPNAIFIFRTIAALTFAAGSVLNLINGAKASNVFFIASGAISLGASSNISGTLISPSDAIGIGAAAFLNGRAFSMVGATTNFGNISVPTGISPFAMGILPNFAIFTSIAAVVNAGANIIIGDIGSNKGTITGFETVNLSGLIYEPSQGGSLIEVSIFIDGVKLITSARERTNITTKEDIVLHDTVAINANQTISVNATNSIGISRFYNRNLTITKI